MALREPNIDGVICRFLLWHACNIHQLELPSSAAPRCGNGDAADLHMRELQDVLQLFFHGLNEERRAGGESPLWQAGTPVARLRRPGSGPACLGRGELALGQQPTGRARACAVASGRLTQVPWCQCGHQAHWVHFSESRNSQFCVALRGI